MSRDFNGSSDRIVLPGAILTATPLTISCMAYSTGGGSFPILVKIGGQPNNSYFMLYRSGGKLSAGVANSTPSFGDSLSVANIPSNAWCHCAGVFTSSTSRQSFLDGVASTANTTNLTPSGLTNTTIGTYTNPPDGVFNNYWQGRIAEVGIWNVALTADEITSLSKGISPALIRRQSLVFYSPLVRDISDIRGGLTLTINGTTVTDHPRIITQ